jgi:hypothetical protein
MACKYLWDTSKYCQNHVPTRYVATVVRDVSGIIRHGQIDHTGLAGCYNTSSSIPNYI